MTSPYHAALLDRLRRAQELQVEHAGNLNSAGELLLRRVIFAAKYALRQEGRERGG
jgi:hypothetical protein